MVRALSYRFPTAIVSGRARATAQGLMQLDGLYYAGSHGFDIDGPGGILAASSILSCVAAHALTPSPPSQASATPFPARWSPCCGPREIYL